MERRELNELCEQVISRFALSRTATYRDACRRVGEVMSELLDAKVEVRFFRSTGTLRFSGATARCRDGSYIVVCVRSSWYHRLGILFHELAHLILEHVPVSLGPETLGVHHPPKMVRINAERSCHDEEAEREAEQVADELLERLIARQGFSDGGQDPTGVAPHFVRIAEGLMDYRGAREDDS